jgi:hypothetical protein
LQSTSDWRGEPAQVLAVLNKIAPEELRHSNCWPANARALSAILRRLAPALRRVGIEYEYKRGERRQIRLCKAGNFASRPSLATQNDANDANFRAVHGSVARLQGLEEAIF